MEILLHNLRKRKNYAENTIPNVSQFPNIKVKKKKNNNKNEISLKFIKSNILNKTNFL